MSTLPFSEAHRNLHLSLLSPVTRVAAPCALQVGAQQRLSAFADVLAASLSDSQGPVAAHEPLPRLAVSFVAANLKVRHPQYHSWPWGLVCGFIFYVQRVLCVSVKCGVAVLWVGPCPMCCVWMMLSSVCG